MEGEQQSLCIYSIFCTHQSVTKVSDDLTRLSWELVSKNSHALPRRFPEGLTVELKNHSEEEPPNVVTEALKVF